MQVMSWQVKQAPRKVETVQLFLGGGNWLRLAYKPVEITEACFLCKSFYKVANCETLEADGPESLKPKK